MLLQLALFCLTESMRKDHDKSSSLIYHNTSSTAGYSGQYYSADSYGQRHQHPSHYYVYMLLEESGNLYNKLPELVDESGNDNTALMREESGGAHYRSDFPKL